METDCLTLRTIRIGTRRAGESEIEVTGNLIDELPGFRAASPAGDGPEARQVHNLTVTLRVRYPALEITAAQATFAAFPDEDCPQVAPLLERLVGVCVAGGFTRAVQERLGRDKGCTHIVSLVLSLATPIYQAAPGLFRPAEPTAEFFEPLVDGCLVWRRGGKLHSGVLRGEYPDIEGFA